MSILRFIFRIAPVLSLVAMASLPSVVSAQVIEPTLTPIAKQGKMVFNKFCAQCHGVNAAGTDKGPPLIHKYYEPNHHGDSSFVRAVKQGVAPHHWRFGAMPPVEGLPDEYIPFVIQYVREMQRANGIR